MNLHKFAIFQNISVWVNDLYYIPKGLNTHLRKQKVGWSFWVTWETNGWRQFLLWNAPKFAVTVWVCQSRISPFHFYRRDQLNQRLFKVTQSELLFIVSEPDFCIDEPRIAKPFPPSWIKFVICYNYLNSAHLAETLLLLSLYTRFALQYAFETCSRRQREGGLNVNISRDAVTDYRVLGKIR